MTVKQLIELLKKYDSIENVAIYVPGDDAGIWRIESENQFRIVDVDKKKNNPGLIIDIY